MFVNSFQILAFERSAKKKIYSFFGLLNKQFKNLINLLKLETIFSWGFLNGFICFLNLNKGLNCYFIYNNSNLGF